MGLYWELAKRTVQEFLKDDCMHMAAGIAYYAFFSVFPLILGLIAVLGFLLEPAEVQVRLLDIVSQFLPGSAEIVTQNVRGVVTSRGTVGILSVVGFLWSATAVFDAIRWSLNRAWNLPKEQPLLQQKLLELGMLAGVGILFLLSMAATVFFRFAGQFVPILAEDSFAWNVALVLLPVTFSFAIFATVYRYLPNTKITWGDVWPGALLAAVLFEISKNLFTWYLVSFANYSLVYGSLSAVVAFLFWAFLSALILLLGAEFTAEFTQVMGSHRKRQSS